MHRSTDMVLDIGDINVMNNEEAEREWQTLRDENFRRMEKRTMSY